MGERAKMKHVMVDCESLGLRNSSVITTIGACEFDPMERGSIGKLLHKSISLESAVGHGLTMDGKTVLWWMEQSDAARTALVAKLKTASSLATVLGAFKTFLRDLGPVDQVKLWSCGWKDLAWLESAYAAIKEPAPWGYRVGDYRTIRDEFMLPTDEPVTTLQHDALADAVWQALALQNIFTRMRA